MGEADKIASLNIGSMETTADDRLSSDPAYLTSRVAELERELRLVRGVATQADATIDQLAKQRDAHMAEIIRAREIIERISGEREAFFVALVGIRLKCVDGVDEGCDEFLANRNLICASPDLLSVAKRWATLYAPGAEMHTPNYVLERTSLLADTREAIAKATGADAND